MDTATPSRNVSLDGVFNFRDLGGYQAADGRSVRWRTVFRADGLGRLTEADLAVLRPIGLKSVLDLRTQQEIGAGGRFPFETYPVTFHHLSVIDQTWDREAAVRENLPATDFLHRAYHAILDAGAPRFAAALRVLAGPDALPAVFHCAAGKDRTGLLAALLLGALGVRHDTIVDDYTLTQATMERFLVAAAGHDPDFTAAVANTPSSFLLADPAAMSLVLADLEREHGSLRSYVRSIGVPDADLRTLDSMLLT